VEAFSVTHFERGGVVNFEQLDQREEARPRRVKTQREALSVKQLYLYTGEGGREGQENRPLRTESKKQSSIPGKRGPLDSGDLNRREDAMES